jgi:dTDP-4-dehydrorhamnose 3,5-epimerase-like enzyme
LHYQLKYTQGKLAHITAGVVFDVAVDLRNNLLLFAIWRGKY